MILTSDQNTAVSNCVALLSEKHYSYKPRVYRLGGFAGTGKSLPIMSRIQTPIGPVFMRDIQVDDLVFGRNGQPTKVTGVYPQGIKQSYRITFRDDFSIEASGDHLWSVWTHKLRSKGKPPVIKTTGEMLKAGVKFNSGPYKYYIPLCESVQYTEKELPIPPYSLGALIGDGTCASSTPVLTLSDDQIIQRVERELSYMHVTSGKALGCVRYWFSSPNETRNTLAAKLRYLQLNVKSGQKFIPQMYLQGSIEQRWDLLRGLMDTDGCSKNNHIRFSTTARAVAKDICTLVQSLGGTAIFHEDDRQEEGKGIEYEVNIKTFENPFYINSKADNWKVSWKNPPSRAIISIVPIIKVEHQCISVAAHDGLFLADNFIVTHNTTCAESIVHTVSNSIPCAFTGKSSWRLIEKGVPGATTIHKAIYRYDIKRKKFFLKDEVLGRYFLVDEGSMVGAKIWADLLSFRKPIIVIGDPGQLQPVADDDPHLMHDPDYVLTEVHRQAMLSGIIQLATDIRKKHQWQSEYPDVTLRTGRRDRQVSNDDLMTHDVTLCGWNDTRVGLNKKYRRLKGYNGLLVDGERIILLRNNWNHHVFNGQMFTVLGSQRISDKLHMAECVDDVGTTKTFNLAVKQFHNPKSPKFAPDQSFVHADYGYAITTHKAQGSEWDNVLVVDEDGGDYWDQTRWRYTAVTRAAKKLTMLSKGM